ncbi:MAG: CPBP family intramembrane metalloprotease [Caulobacter sp.]|nr:CPBP family intramembrane metalloprotease [Caulobacter sp.]
MALSLPFYLLGVAFDGPTRLLPIALPISALMAFAPMIAAIILSYRQGGGGAVRRLFGRLGSPPLTGRPWLALAALVMIPLALLLEWIILGLLGTPLPSPRLPMMALIGFAPMFLVGAIGEELGWQGYLYPRLEARWSAVTASLALGAFWALWHVVPFLQAGRAPEWIFWQCLTMLPLRLLTVWFYSAGGRSVALAVVFHAACNVAQFMFPNLGSHYDPKLTFLILAGIALVWALAWRPRASPAPAGRRR